MYISQNGENNRLLCNLKVSYTSSDINTIQRGLVKFRSRRYNNAIPGPTLRIVLDPTSRVDTRLVMNFQNLLDDEDEMHMNTDVNVPHGFNTFNNHVHGLHVSPHQDDVFVKIHPGDNYTYAYDISKHHHAGTAWYHPHKHGSTAVQSYSGMSGTLIIEGGAEHGDLNSVPEIKKADEIIFHVSELNMNTLGNIDMDIKEEYEVAPFNRPLPFSTTDSVLVVNGVQNPTLHLQTGQLARLRILNASPRLDMLFEIQKQTHSGHSSESELLYVCAIDGITMNRMRTVPRIKMTPGNRCDLLIKLTRVGSYDVVTFDGDNKITIAQIIVQGDNMNMQIPGKYLPTPKSITHITEEECEKRNLIFSVTSNNGPRMPLPDDNGNFYSNRYMIDGELYSPDSVGQTMCIGDIIEWTIYNADPDRIHPFHIHIHPFELVETSDNLVLGMPFEECVWLDTVAVPAGGYVKIRQKYEDFPGKHMLHCHNMSHEDLGMMQVVHLQEQC